MTHRSQKWATHLITHLQSQTMSIENFNTVNKTPVAIIIWHSSFSGFVRCSIGWLLTFSFQLSTFFVPYSPASSWLFGSVQGSSSRGSARWWPTSQTRGKSTRPLAISHFLIKNLPRYCLRPSEENPRPLSGTPPKLRFAWASPDQKYLSYACWSDLSRPHLGPLVSVFRDQFAPSCKCLCHIPTN